MMSMILRGFSGYVYQSVQVVEAPLMSVLASHILYIGWWLSHPSEKMTSSVGIMKFPIWKNNLNVPNHQPAWICLKTNGTPLKSSKVDPFSSMTQWPHNVGRLFPHFQTLLKIILLVTIKSS